METSSTTELKFVFPATGTTGTNNATISLTAGSTGITITNIYNDEYFDYDCWCWVEDRLEDVIRIPTSVTGTLSVGGSEISKIEASAKYKRDNYDFDDFKADGYPESTSLKISTKEKYVIEYNLSGSGKETKYDMKLTHDNKGLIEAMFKMDMDLDEIFDKIENVEDVEDIYAVYGKVKSFGYLKMMDNLVLAYQADDIANFAKEMDEIQTAYRDAEEKLNWSSNNYWTQEMALREKRAKDEEKAMNNYIKVSLVSTSDRFKIADLIAKAEIIDEYTEYTYQGNPVVYKRWDTNLYLKFSDSTLVEAEAYFSTGFSKLEKKWEDFVDAFNR